MTMEKITLKDLYPKLNEEELQAVEECFTRYLLLALQIYERIRSEPDLYAQFKQLTAKDDLHTMHEDRSIPL